MIRVSGGATLLLDDLGRLTAHTQALVTLLADSDSSPGAKAGSSPGGHAGSRVHGRQTARAR